MRRAADVIVIGGGIIGCAVARELGRRGAAIRMLEARTLGAGATHASAGVLAPLIEAHERGPLRDLGLRSLAMYDDFVRTAEQESGLPIEYRRCGTLQVAPDEESAGQLRPDSSEGHELTWLVPEDVRRLEPALKSELRGAVLASCHGYVKVSGLTDALAWAALRYGAQIEAGRHVVSVTRDGESLVVATADGSRWSASDVILAAGSWSGQLGLQERAANAVHPIRGQLLRMGWNGPPLTHIIWGPDCYVVPWVDGSVLVGATVEDVGFDERATAAGVRDLLEAVCDLLPDAWRATFLEARVGLRPATSDGLPVIGRSTVLPGVVYATGHFRNGILLAPLTAMVVANLVINAEVDPLLTITAPSRFT